MPEPDFRKPQIHYKEVWHKMSSEELVRQIQAGVDTADNMAALYNQNRGLIYTIARKYKAYEDMDDLMQEGYLGLYDAAEHFDPAAGASFGTYAAYWIRQRIQRYLHSQGSVRLPEYCRIRMLKYKRLRSSCLLEYNREPTEAEIQRHLELSQPEYDSFMKDLSMAKIGSLDAPIPADESGETSVGDLVASNINVEEDAIQSAMQEAVRAAVNKLEDRQSQVIQARYFDNKTLAGISEDIGVTPEVVRQIEAKGIRELRKPRNSRHLREYLDLVECDAYHSIGAKTFQRTHTSSVESTILRIEEMTARQRPV